MLLRTSYSAIQKFTQCPRAWYLGDYRRLGPVTEPPTGALKFGGRMHTAIELGTTGVYETPLHAWKALMQKEYEIEESLGGFSMAELEKEAVLGTVMLESLDEWRAVEGDDQEFEVVAVEKQLREELLIHTPAGDEVSVWLYGKLDELLVHRDNGQVWIRDWKHLPLTEPVLTPNGWVPMGELEEGDTVVGSDGKATQIYGISPVTTQDVWEVEMFDGTVVRCSGTHKWLVNTTDTPTPQVVTTEEMAATPLRSRTYWRVPVLSGPVEYATTGEPLPISPYALGLLIADGYLAAKNGHITFSSKDGETAALLAEHIPLKDCRHYGNFNWAPVEQVPLRAALEALGLLGKLSADKFIPREYLLAPVEDRLALLQGLYDGDGLRAQQRYTTCSPQLAEDVVELIRSLGGKANLNRSREEVRPGSGRVARNYHVNFSFPTDEFARLPEKRASWHPKRGAAWRAIKAIRKTSETTEMRCIAVTAEDQLYVTRGFVITHNTTKDLQETAISGVEASPQPRIYARLLEQELPGTHIAGIRYTFLRKVQRSARAKPPFVFAHDMQLSKYNVGHHMRRVEAITGQMVDTFRALEHEVDHEYAAPFTPGWWCSSCPFKNVCYVMQTVSNEAAEDMLTDFFTEKDPLERYDHEEMEA